MATAWTFRRKAACLTGACVLLLLTIWASELAPPARKAARAFIRRPDTKELQQLIRSADSIQIRAAYMPGFVNGEILPVTDKAHIEKLSEAAVLETRMHPREDSNVKWGMKSHFFLTLIADETPFANLSIRGFTSLSAELPASFGRIQQFDGDLDRRLCDEIFELQKHR